MAHDTQHRTASDASNRSDNVLQLVSFRVGEEEFGLEILRVQEIIRFQQLTRVPNLPNFVEGVLNLRGKVIPVIGLRQRLGLERQSATKTTKIVVANVRNEVLGFVVDSVSEVLRISSDTVEAPPRLGEKGEGVNQYVLGIGKLDNRLLLLLDFDHLLSDEQRAEVTGFQTELPPTAEHIPSAEMN
jgi:purine-binding chemotaxis protein CheW